MGANSVGKPQPFQSARLDQEPTQNASKSDSDKEGKTQFSEKKAHQQNDDIGLEPSETLDLHFNDFTKLFLHGREPDRIYDHEYGSRSGFPKCNGNCTSSSRKVTRLPRNRSPIYKRSNCE
jgi:hypothetical protein